MSKNTLELFEEVFKQSFQIYEKKLQDYGVAWRVLRLPSITDQIYIKCKRIITIQELKENKVGESIENEFHGIINYSIIALIQLEKGRASNFDMRTEEALNLYEKFKANTIKLFEKKNHDYGEAWKEMRTESITDLIYQKTLRVKQIESQDGKTLISEGVDANYMDMIIYSIFCIIKINNMCK